MYALTEAHRAQFARDGYCVLKGFLPPAEVAAAARAFDSLASGALPVEGKDRGVHTPGLLNVTAFSLYHPLESIGDDALDAECGGRGVLARIDARALDVTRRLYGEAPTAESAFARDYEQLLRKLPAQPRAQFPPHQDMHYWPKSKSGAFDTRTTTVSVAVNAADEERGCLWVLPGSHKSRELYAGCVTRRSDSRPDGGGVIELTLLPEDVPRRVFVPLEPGDCSVHDEWLVHGSEGNAHADASRDTLILAYRTKAMIALERSVGFKHSYNDGEEVLRMVREREWD
jgi:ectoine hydroxylase-related dioxygenase (phytanoyl-CoA dioxygenase family)